MSGPILITGADGFIGSHLVEALVRSGRPVRALALYDPRGGRGWLDHLPADVLDAVDIRAGDIRDPQATRDLVRGCKRVLHLAALIGIPYSYQAPDSYLDTNLRGTLNLLQAARDAGVVGFVQTSTSEVYGSAQRVPMDETHPLQAQSPYAATKIGGDHLALSFHASFGLPVAVIRPFNTYGPRQSARAVIPTVIAQIARGRRRLRLGALHPTRDFNYVADTVAGFLAVMNAPAAVGEVLNIGTGLETSIGDLVSRIAHLMGAEVEIETDHRRLRPEASEVDRLCADAAKARRLTGWEPRYGGREGLERGLAETIAWFTDPENLRALPHGYQV